MDCLDKSILARQIVLLISAFADYPWNLFKKILQQDIK